MWDTIQKLRYRANAEIAEAKTELNLRLENRAKLPLKGLHGEALYLTAPEKLLSKATELEALYQALPELRGVQDMIVLDAWSSATIEGARTTVAQVKASFDDPQTKDDRMVINTVSGSKYAFSHPISEKNIRFLWEKIVDGVCENPAKKGTLYRSGMVYIANATRKIHDPATPEQLPQLMADLFAFRSCDGLNPLLNSFITHFYFVYVHPFCDGNGRTARILNISQLYHSGYKKVKSISLSNAINQQLSGYYSSLTDSEQVLQTDGEKWLDLSPFVSYMLDTLERSIINAALSANTPTPQEKKLLERMNKVGPKAEITVQKAAKILGLSDTQSRRILRSLVSKGYLTIDETHSQYIYRLMQHIPE